MVLARFVEKMSGCSGGERHKGGGTQGQRAWFALLFLSCLSGLSAAAQLVDFKVGVNTTPTYSASIKPGETTSLRITLTNESAGAFSGVSFSKALPSTGTGSLVVVGNSASITAAPTSGACTGGAVTVADGSGNVSLSGLTIPAKVGANPGQCFIDIPITARSLDGASQTHTYALAVGEVSMSGGDTNGEGGSQGITVQAVGRPTWNKSFTGNGAVAVLGGTGTTLRLSITNPSSGIPLSGVGFADVFPTAGAGGAVIEPSGSYTASVGCGSPTVNLTTGSAAQVVVSGASLAVGATCTIDIPVVARQTNGSYELSNQTNTVLASSFSSDQGLRPSANDSATVTVRSPLSVTKSFAGSPIASGQNSTFTIRLSNNGDTDLSVTSFNDDPIDSGGVSGQRLTPSAINNSCGGTNNLTANGIQTSGYSIPAHGQCDITVTFSGTTGVANTPRVFTNAIASGAVNTPVAGIVSESRSATVTVVDELWVQKTRNPAYAAPGAPVQYTVTVQNFSGSSHSDVHVMDVLQNGATFLTGTHNGTDYTPTLTPACGTLSGIPASGASGTLDFVVQTLPAWTAPSTPGSCTVSFWALTDKNATTGTNNQIATCGVWYGSQASATCNGSASNVVSTSYQAALVAEKTFNGTNYTTTGLTKPEGSIVTMRIRVSNFTDQALANLGVNDNLQLAQAGTALQQLRIADPANASTTCGGTVTATPGSTSLALNGGAVPARNTGTNAAGTCVLQVDVVGPAGIYQNYASVSATQTYGDGATALISGVNTNTAVLTYTGALETTKSFNPSSVTSGGRSRVTIRLENKDTSSPITGISVQDPLPTGMVLADPPGTYSTCAGSPAFTGAAGASSIGMTDAALPAGGSCDLIFDVVATGASNWVNNIPVGNITADGGISNQTAVSATLTRVAPQVPTISKAISPTAVAPGEVAELTITITNSTQALSNLSLTDYFTMDGTAGGTANGMQIATPTGASTTCPGGNVTATAGAKQVSLSGGTLAAGATCVIKANVTSATVGNIVNIIPMNALASDQGQTNSTTQASATLQTTSNVGLFKQFIPDVIKAGERARLRITLYNPTVQALSDFAVTDTLPAGITVPSGPGITQTCGTAQVDVSDPGKVVITHGALAAAVGGVATSCQVELDVTAAATGNYDNVIPANSVTVGGTPVTHPPAEATLKVSQPLTVHKAIATQTLDAGNPVGFTTGTANRKPGEEATLTVRLDNPNATALTEITFTDNLPSGLVIAQTPGAATTCTSGVVTALASGTQLRLTGATLAGGASCTVSVQVLSNVPGTYTNTIASGGVTTLEGVSNEEATQARLIVSQPPAVSKQFAPAVIPPGGTSTLTIVLGNDNASAITLTAALVDNLPTAPGPVLVASPANLSTTCPGTVTATAGAASVTYANGATIPAGGCTINVDVTGSTPGAHTNNIPVGALITSAGNNPDPANAVLSISTAGYISGKVFKDNNLTPDGVYQSGTDDPLASVTVELRSGSSCAGALLATTSTDSLGNYLFSGLAAGTYSVCEPAQPTGTVNGITTAGSIVPVSGSGGSTGVAANPGTPASQITGIVLGQAGGGEVSGSVGNNFAEVATSTISGVVFLDNNNNGVLNGTDSGIAGVTLELLNQAGTVVATTVTAADGSYSFTNLSPGQYAVREPSQPAGTSNGLTVAGSVANGGTAGSVTTTAVTPSVIGGTTRIILPPNTVSSGNNFAEIPNTRKVSGRIFLDFDNNGLLDGSDHGISGQSVRLTGTDINGNLVDMTVTTGADGSYLFDAVPEGSAYTLTQPAQPAGTTNGITTAGTTGGVASGTGTTPSTITSVNLAGANMVSADNNFAEIPGNAPDLTLTKTHAPDTLGAGSTTGFYTLTPGNIGAVATSGQITVVDTLPTGITALGTPTGSGWTCSVAGQVVTCTSSNVIAAGGTGSVITLKVAVAAGTEGQLLINTATVSGGSEPSGFSGNNTATDPTPIAVSASVQGKVWRDLNHDRVLDAGEPLVPNWDVELLLNGTVVATTSTDSSGAYAFTGLAPGSGYQIRFKEPNSGNVYGRPVPNESGGAYTNGVVNAGTNPAGADNSDGTLRNLTLAAGTNTVEQSLPLDPSGVVYDAVTRQPVSGAIVTISGPAGFDAADVVGGSLSQNTGADGFYQFLLFATAPAGTYTLTVTAPGGYLPTPSSLIPACTNTLAVGAVPDPALVQSSGSAPSAGVTAHDPAACLGLVAAGQATTQYYFSFTLTPGTSANVLNNHIPLDPVQGGAIIITKTTPFMNVTKGDLVPYTITATNTLSAALTGVSVQDQLPPGFKYRNGSASVNGVYVEPKVAGRTLTWQNQSFTAGERKTYKLILVVGSGVGEGEYINQAWALNSAVGSRISNIGTAMVRVVPDPTFDCSDIIGKVFDDKNANGYQDQGELGIPNVRMATARGLLVTSDAEGRFHVACAAIPQMDRGSNFVMKLDERTLPSGFRVTTENPRDVRVTRGKMVKLNFGATVHKVVRVELDARAFAGDGNELQPEWAARLPDIIKTLQERPSVLRLAYRQQAGDTLGAGRLKRLATQMGDMYQQNREAQREAVPPEASEEPPDIPPLLVETEVFNSMQEGK